MNNQSTKGVSETPQEQAGFDVWEAWCDMHDWVLTEQECENFKKFIKENFLPRTEAVSRKELRQKISSMKRIIEQPKSDSCFTCGEFEDLCDCYGYNQALSNILSLL